MRGRLVRRRGAVVVVALREATSVEAMGLPPGRARARWSGAQGSGTLRVRARCGAVTGAVRGAPWRGAAGRVPGARGQGECPLAPGVVARAQVRRSDR